MKRTSPAADWPESWKLSYEFDRCEVYGECSSLGYGYAYQNRKARTLSMVQKFVAPGSRILDVAAAAGNFSLSLAELGYEVVWNDIRSELQGYVEQKYESGSILYRPGNVLEVEFSEKFDAVLMTEVIEHVAHPDQFLVKVGGLVKESGYVIATTPNGAYCRNSLPKFSEFSNPDIFESRQFGPDSEDHIFLLHLDEIPKLAAAAGLKVVESGLGTLFLTNGHLKTEALLRVLPKGLVLTLDSIAEKLPDALKAKLMTNMYFVLQKDASIA